MDLIPKQSSDGTWKFYGRCNEHNWFYKGLPPLTTGCKECWEVYYFMQAAQVPSEKMAENTDALESAIHHLVEADQRGEWDFQPFDHPEVTISHDDDN